MSGVLTFENDEPRSYGSRAKNKIDTPRSSAKDLAPPITVASRSAHEPASSYAMSECPSAWSPELRSSCSGPPTPRSMRAHNKIIPEQNEVTLRFEREDATAPAADRFLYVCVLKELLGEELRVVIRDELKSALSKDARSFDVDRREAAVDDASSLDATRASVTAKVFFRGPTPDESYPAGSAYFEPQVTRRKSTDTECSPENVTNKVIRKHMNRIGAQEHTDLYNTLNDRSVSDLITDCSPCIGRLTARVGRAFHVFGTQRAPQRSDCISRIADNAAFALAIQFVIILNCAFMVYAADNEVKNYLTGPSDLVVYGDYCFLAAYSFEFLVRIARHRQYYFYDVNFVQNWLDLIILLASAFSMFIADSMPNVSFLRLLRMLRMLKVLRVLRVISMFSTLRAIVVSLTNTFGTLFWSMVMICVIHFVFALLFVMRVASYFSLRGESLDAKEEQELTAAFGTTGRAFLSLLYATNGGNDWSQYFEALLVTGGLDSLLFLCFVAFAQIALLNIILGIFVDQAIKSLMNSKEEKAKEHATELLKIEEDLRMLCAEADVDNSGRISEEEWKACIGHGNMQSYLDLSGFRVHDVHDYFQICRNEAEDNKVDVENFVRGCMRLRGPASCFDMQMVLAEVLTLNTAIKDQQRALKKLSTEFEKQCHPNHAPALTA